MDVTRLVVANNNINIKTDRNSDSGKLKNGMFQGYLRYFD